MRLSFYGNTSAGRQRDHNEDSYLILCDVDNNWLEINNHEIDSSKSKGVVFVVADGMGGANAGEVASDIAVNTVKERMTKIGTFPEDTAAIHKILNSIVLEGHNRIIKASRRNNVMEGMGTTIVMGYIYKDTLYVLWSGDSRCYIYNKNFDKELLPFTDDHSLVWERVKNMELTAEEARLSADSNLILQSLGGALERPEPEFKRIKLKKNDRILFCSDGLNSMLSNIGIQQILDFNSSPKETCESLIQAANNAGGRDNITAIVADVVDVADVSDNYEAITESDSNKNKNKKQKKRKKPYILLVLLILILIIASGIYFRSEIANVFLLKFARDSTRVVQETDFNNSTEQSNLNSGVNLKPSIDFGKSDSILNIYRKMKNSPLINNNNIRIDSNNIEIQLQEAISKISSIKDRIRIIKPDGAIYNPDFYNENKERFDSILNKLEHQDSLIKSVAILNANNHLIKITDYSKADEIYVKIGESLTELEKKTTELIVR